MTGVSSVAAWELSEGEGRVACEGPAVLTACVVGEQSGSDPALLDVTGAAGEGPYFRLRVGPGGALIIPVTVALPWGLAVTCQVGEATVSVCYR